jgi:hypothetical protein
MKLLPLVKRSKESGERLLGSLVANLKPKLQSLLASLRSQTMSLLMRLKSKLTSSRT